MTTDQRDQSGFGRERHDNLDALEAARADLMALGNYKSAKKRNGEPLPGTWDLGQPPAKAAVKLANAYYWHVAPDGYPDDKGVVA